MANTLVLNSSMTVKVGCVAGGRTQKQLLPRAGSPKIMMVTTDGDAELVIKTWPPSRAMPSGPHGVMGVVSSLLTIFVRLPSIEGFF